MAETNTTLTLTGLPPHNSINLSFLLAIIDSWDGDGCFAGVTDAFNVTVDGVSIFSEVFENSNCGTQTYIPPVGVELARKLDLGFNTPEPPYGDSAYDMGLDPSFQNIPHTSSTLTVEWFTSGGGWQGGDDESWAIDNVVVLVADEDVTGKANFGFVSKYKRGATVPTGDTEFQFKAGDLNFHSSSYDWLVINQGGVNAQFKGEGTINGAVDVNGNPFKFMLWAGDKDPDTFRIRIWSELDEVETDVYDNGNDDVPDQIIGGGSIKVHSK